MNLLSYNEKVDSYDLSRIVLGGVFGGCVLSTYIRTAFRPLEAAHVLVG